MSISSLCSKDLICVERGASLQYAAQLMKSHNIGGIVVVESNGKRKPVGVITDRDIVLGTVAENRSINARVEEVMSKGVVQVVKNEGIAEVVDRMEREGVRRMVVVDDAGNACGLVSADDILQLVAREIYGLGRVVQRQVNNEKLVKPLQSELII